MKKEIRMVEKMNHKNLNQVKDLLDDKVSYIWMMEDGDGQMCYNVELDYMFEHSKNIDELKEAVIDFLKEFEHTV